MCFLFHAQLLAMPIAQRGGLRFSQTVLIIRLRLATSLRQSRLAILRLLFVTVLGIRTPLIYRRFHPALSRTGLLLWLLPKLTIT